MEKMKEGFRDLSSRGVAAKVKEEVDDGCDKDNNNRDFMRGSGIQWSFSNNGPSLSQIMSFKTVQGVRSKKTADSFDPNHKTAISIYQKSFNPTEQCSTHYAMATYPSQHFNAVLAQEIEEASVSNRRISGAVINPFFKTHFVPATENPVAANIKQQLLDGTVTVPHSVVPVASSACPRSISKSNGSPAQLTIFYAGTVNVYDDVSPEKAHAIMFLAADGSPPTNANIIGRAQVLTPLQKRGGDDDMPEKQLYCSPHSLNVTSNVGTHEGSGSSSNNKPIAAKPMKASIFRTKQLDPLNVTSFVSTATTLIPSAVPQARRASLVRFLEKRKERVMNRAPYEMNKKSPDNITTPEPSGGDSAVA